MNSDNMTKENFNKYSEWFWNMLFQIDMFLFENDELENNEHSNYNQLDCIYWIPKETDNNFFFDILSDHNLSIPDRFTKVSDIVDLVFKHLFKFSHDNNIFFEFCSSKVYENTFEGRFKEYENKFIDVERIEFIKSELKTVLNSTIFRFNLFSIENQTIIKNTKVKKTEFLQSISKDFNIKIIENDDIDLLKRNKYRVEIDKELINSNTAPTGTETKTPYKVIALLHWYNNKSITRYNAGKIAKQYNYTAKTSGDGLYHDYLKYSNNADRLASGGTKLKLKNKIQLFENVIKLLTDENAINRAQTDLKTLQSKKKTFD